MYLSLNPSIEWSVWTVTWLLFYTDTCLYVQHGIRTTADKTLTFSFIDFFKSKSKASMDMYNLVKLSERYNLAMLDVSETSILWLSLICYSELRNHCLLILKTHIFVIWFIIFFSPSNQVLRLGVCTSCISWKINH